MKLIEILSVASFVFYGGVARAEQQACSEYKDEIVNKKPSRPMEQVRCMFNYYGMSIDNAFQKELKDNPSFQDGTIKIRLIIGSNGVQTKPPQIISSEVNAPTLDAEIIQIVSHFIFPASKGPAEEFIFPINLYKN